MNMYSLSRRAANLFDARHGSIIAAGVSELASQ